MPFPMGDRDDAGRRFPVGPDGTILIPANDPSVMKALPDFLVLHGALVDPAIGPLEDPSRPSKEVFDSMVTRMRDGLLGDKPQDLPDVAQTFLELVALRQGIGPSEGQGEDRPTSAEALEPASLALMTANNQHARVRAVLDPTAVQPLPGYLGGLRQRKRMLQVATDGVELFKRGVAALENRIDPVIRKSHTALKAFEQVPEVWRGLSPVSELVSGAAERGLKTRDMRSKAKQEGFDEGFKAGMKAAQEAFKAAAANTPKP